jgi:hypothetical protein
VSSLTLVHPTLGDEKGTTTRPKVLVSEKIERLSITSCAAKCRDASNKRTEEKPKVRHGTLIVGGSVVLSLLVATRLASGPRGDSSTAISSGRHSQAILGPLSVAQAIHPGNRKKGRKPSEKGSSVTSGASFLAPRSSEIGPHRPVSWTREASLRFGARGDFSDGFSRLDFSHLAV